MNAVYAAARLRYNPPMNNQDLLRRIESADIACTREHYDILTESEALLRKYSTCDLDGAWVFIESKNGQRIGRVFGLGIEQPASRQTLKTAVDWLFQQGANSIRVRVCPVEGNAGLPAWLNDFGFTQTGHIEQWCVSSDPEFQPLQEPVSSKKLKPIRPRSLVCPFTIREISIDASREFASIVGTNYHLGKHTDLSWWERQVGMPGCVAFVAYDEDVPVGTGMLQCREDQQICVLGYGTTLKAYRKRGLQNSMISVRLQKSRELGYSLAAASTFGTDQSSHNLRRQGFRHAGTIGVYTKNCTNSNFGILAKNGAQTK